MLARCTAAFCLIALLSTVTFAAAPVVEPTGMWNGKVKDESLRKLSPQSGFIADAETWKTLWTAWRPGEELPNVDFTKELILVGTVPGPNQVVMRPTITDNGNVKLIVFGTEIGGPGFGYKLIKMVKDGVKSVNGNAIEAKGVQGVLVIPKTVGSFEGHTLEIKLWEYDPFLADVSAKLVDEFDAKTYGHTQGKDTETTFSVGTKLEPRQDRRYYITVFVLKDGKRTHIGEQGGKSGLCKVLTQGNPSSVKMIARVVR
jgi:hypothetical protein